MESRYVPPPNSVFLTSFILAPLLLITPCGAQSPPKSVTIDGSVTPAQIPDSIAYRLVLTVASINPKSSIDEGARQRAFLIAAGLSENEVAPASTVISQFQQQASAINQSSKTTDEQNSRLDALVTNTMSSMAAVLSPASMTRLSSFIQSEKCKMRTTSSTPMP